MNFLEMRIKNVFRKMGRYNIPFLQKVSSSKLKISRDVTEIKDQKVKFW